MMNKYFKLKTKKNFELFTLIFIIILSTLLISYFNYNKKESVKIYSDFTDNIYLKKTLNHIINNLEPKYLKIKHKIKSGETFDKILKNYKNEKNKIKKIKNYLKEKVNLYKLNTKQVIQFNIDKTDNKISEFTFQISSTQKIFLKRNKENDLFNEEIISVKLNKKIIYSENLILQSLYKSATEQKIPPNIIVEFAGIYGFQVDFQRDIRKKINSK